MTNFRQKLAFSAASAFQFPFFRLIYRLASKMWKKPADRSAGFFVYGRNNLKDAS